MVKKDIASKVENGTKWKKNADETGKNQLKERNLVKLHKNKSGEKAENEITKHKGSKE